MARSIALLLFYAAGLASSWCSRRGTIAGSRLLPPVFILMSALSCTPGTTGDGEGGSALPELPPASEDKSETRQLELGGSLSMDELGPIIINPDGTTRRITNWDTLTTQEKKSSWRLISKRNKERLAKLKLEQDKEKEKEKEKVQTQNNVQGQEQGQRQEQGQGQGQEQVEL